MEVKLVVIKTCSAVQRKTNVLLRDCEQFWCSLGKIGKSFSAAS